MPDDNLPARRADSSDGISDEVVVPLNQPAQSFEWLVANRLSCYPTTPETKTSVVSDPRHRGLTPAEQSALTSMELWVPLIAPVLILLAVSPPFVALLVSGMAAKLAVYGFGALLCYFNVLTTVRAMKRFDELSVAAKVPPLRVGVTAASAYRDFVEAVAMVKASDPAPEVLLGLEERVGFMEVLLVESARLTAGDTVDGPQASAVTARMAWLAAEAYALAVLARRRQQVIEVASLETETVLAQTPDSMKALGDGMAEETAFITEVLNP